MRPKLCISIMEENVENFIRASREISEGDLIEARVDYLKEASPTLVKRLLKSIKTQANKPIILVNRMESEGGLFSGDESKRLEILLESLELCDFIDIELNSERNLRDKIIESAKEKRKRIIISYLFKSFPEKNTLMNIIERELNLGDIAKISLKISSPKELLEILEILLEVKRFGEVIVVPLTKSYAVYPSLLYFGSKFLYVYHKKPAEGYIDLETAKNLIKLVE